MLIILSLFFIFIENSLALNGVILFTSLPFISYIIRKGKSFIYLFLVYIMVALQTDRYFYLFLVFLIYIILNIGLLSHIEYNKKTIFYILLLQVLFYFIITLQVFNLKYFILNICGFIFWNFIYAKYIEVKGK